jgi:hypothetical protein
MPRKYVLTLIVVAIIFFGGIFFILNRSSSGSKTTNQESSKSAPQTKQFSDNATEVKYTIYGKVVGDEDRRAIRITVNDSERKLEILQGYDEHVIDSKTFGNNSTAFKDFLLALQGANFSVHDTSIKTDDKTLCPLGKRYVYEADYYDGSDSLRSWTTSCTSKGTTFKGSRSTVDSLFRGQITDYDKLTRQVSL